MFATTPNINVVCDGTNLLLDHLRPQLGPVALVHHPLGDNQRVLPGDKISRFKTYKMENHQEVKRGGASSKWSTVFSS